MRLFGRNPNSRYAETDFFELIQMEKDNLEELLECNRRLMSRDYLDANRWYIVTSEEELRKDLKRLRRERKELTAEIQRRGRK